MVGKLPWRNTRCSGTAHPTGKRLYRRCTGSPTGKQKEKQIPYRCDLGAADFEFSHLAVTCHQLFEYHLFVAGDTCFCFVQPGSFCIGMRWIWHCHAVPLYSGWHFQHRCRNRLRRNHRFAVQALLDCHESNLPVLRTCPALVWKSLLWKGVVSI